MIRKTKRNLIALFAAISIVSASIVVLGQSGFAGSGAPTTALNYPTVNMQIPSSGGKGTTLFVATGSDPQGTRVRTQIMYRKLGTARWTSFGTASSDDPNGRTPQKNPGQSSIPNGITGKYLNAFGWNCQMGWGKYPAPASCDSIWSNSRTRGKSAFSGAPTYTPYLTLPVGQYEWTARSFDDANYGSWSAVRRFSVNSTPTPPPPPPPPPPDDNGGGDYTPPSSGGGGGGYTPSQSSSDETSSNPAAPIVEDKEPPTSPADLKGEYVVADSSILLTWTESKDNYTVAGYEIERTEEGKEGWAAIGKVATARFLDFNFEPQKGYQYRVRAYDSANNFSAYSQTVTVTAGAFSPNVTVKDGGTVSDNDKRITVEFPASATSQDLFISIEKTTDFQPKIENGSKMIGDMYSLKAKNSKGEEVKKFLTQIKLRFKYFKNETKGANTNTIKLGYVNEDGNEILKSKLNTKESTIETLTDHFSAYYLVAEKSSPWITFLQIVLWILVIIAIGVGAYFAWAYFQKKQYQKEHREDYIYKA